MNHIPEQKLPVTAIHQVATLGLHRASHHVTLIRFTVGLRTSDVNTIDGAAKDLELCMQAVTAIHLSASFRQPRQA